MIEGKYKSLERALHNAGLLCQPDRYVVRQNDLLHALAEYVIERDKVVVLDEEEEDDS